jgi:hypothetical protein
MTSMPARVQRLDHVPELVEMGPDLGRHAVPGLGGEVGERVVAPVVPERRAVDRAGPEHLHLIEVEDGQQLDRRDPELGEVRDLLDDAGERARRVDLRRWIAGETPDVHLVDDRLVHRAAQRPVPLPVVRRGVDDDARMEVARMSSGPRAPITSHRVLEFALAYGSIRTLFRL